MTKFNIGTLSHDCNYDIDILESMIHEYLFDLKNYSFEKHKWIYWSYNPIGDFLFDCITGLEHIGIIFCPTDDNTIYSLNKKYTCQDFINQLDKIKATNFREQLMIQEIIE